MIQSGGTAVRRALAFFKQEIYKQFFQAGNAGELRWDYI